MTAAPRQADGMDPVPAWFTAALAAVPETYRVTVDGASINVLSWGERDRPGLVFVHGGAAHAHWWSHIAPMFLPDYRVVAIDLSGHGDSDRRADYSLRAWTDEVAAVVDHAAFSEPPVVIGHSMGGFVTIATAAWQADMIGSAVIIDSPVVAMDPEVERARRTDEFTKAKVYDDPAAPIARFRTIPEQDTYLPFVKDHVAQHSLHQLEDGRWGWKFDPTIFNIPPHHTVDIGGDLLPDISCPVALLRCEHGLVTPDIGDYMLTQLGRPIPVIELPTAGHHPMLDVPLILAAALRSLLATWTHPPR